METAVNPAASDNHELDWLLEIERKPDPRRYVRAAVASLAVHVLIVLFLPYLPLEGTAPDRRLIDKRKATPIIYTPFEMTQKTPNKGKISKELTAENLLPRPNIQVPRSERSTTRPAAKNLAMPTPTPAPEPTLPEPPKVDPVKAADAAPKAPPPTQIAQTIPPPRLETEERKPAPVGSPQGPVPGKLQFETPGAPPPPANPRAMGRAQSPGEAVNEAVRSLARGGQSGGLVVGDLGVGIGGIGDGMNLPPSPGKQGSALELLSDPMGVDFRPYLIRILSAVRRNWFAVMPESAKLGKSGKVAIQFAISRDGRVPKLVIATPSGTEALDRAAVAGISASNPFPPLPDEFKGNQIRLQFTFAYNQPGK